MNYLAKLLGLILVIGLAGLSVGQTITLFNFILPPEKGLEAFLGPTITEVAVLVWGLTFVYDAPLGWQKAIAGIMTVLSFASVGVCLIAEANIDLLRHGYGVDPNLVKYVVIFVWLAVFIHIGTWFLMHMLGILHKEGVIRLEQAARYTPTPLAVETQRRRIEEEKNTDPLAVRPPFFGRKKKEQATEVQIVGEATKP